MAVGGRDLGGWCRPGRGEASTPSIVGREWSVHFESPPSSAGIPHARRARIGATVGGVVAAGQRPDLGHGKQADHSAAETRQERSTFSTTVIEGGLSLPCPLLTRDCENSVSTALQKKPSPYGHDSRAVRQLLGCLGGKPDRATSGPAASADACGRRAVCFLQFKLKYLWVSWIHEFLIFLLTLDT